MYKFQDHWYEVGERVIYLPDLHSNYEYRGDHPRIYWYQGHHQSEDEIHVTDSKEEKVRNTSLNKNRCVPYSEEMWKSANSLYNDYFKDFDVFHKDLKKLKQGKIAWKESLA